MNSIEVLHFLPLLQKQDPHAALVYVTAKHFCDKKDRLTIKLALIADHLGLTREQMKDACKLLREFGLLDKEDSVTLCPAKQSCKPETELLRFALQEVPEEFLVLHDEKQMFECYTTLGNVLWKVLAQVALYFHLDFPTLQRVMINKDFKKKFLETRRAVEKIAEITGTKVTKRKRKRAASKTKSELIKQLETEVHIKNGIEIPKNEWKAPQLLRVFVLMYRKRYGEDYMFTGNPFQSMEMREIKKIYEALDQEPLDVIAYLNWCFGTKSYETAVMNPLRIRFCSSDNVIREFLRVKSAGDLGKPSKKKESVSKRSEIPTDFIEWVITNYPEVQKVFHLSKMEDLQWIKQAYEANDLPHSDLKPIVERAIESQLV